MRKTPTTSRKKATIPPYLLKRYAIFVNDHLEGHISETSSESVKRQSYKYKAGRDERPRSRECAVLTRHRDADPVSKLAVNHGQASYQRCPSTLTFHSTRTLPLLQTKRNWWTWYCTKAARERGREADLVCICRRSCSAWMATTDISLIHCKENKISVVAMIESFEETP